MEVNGKGKGRARAKARATACKDRGTGMRKALGGDRIPRGFEQGFARNGVSGSITWKLEAYLEGFDEKNQRMRAIIARNRGAVDRKHV